MPWQLKAIEPETFCFFRGIHPNGLHFVLKLQVWIYTKKVITISLLAMLLQTVQYSSSSNDITKLTITFFTKDTDLWFLTIKCRSLGCIPLKMYNF